MVEKSIFGDEKKFKEKNIWPLDFMGKKKKMECHIYYTCEKTLIPIDIMDCWA